MATFDAYMPYYGNDFEQATKALQPAVKWAYLCALWYYWSHTHCQGLPDSDEKLRGICGVERSEWPEAKAEIFGPFFKLDHLGMWQQERSRDEYNKSQAAYSKRVESIRKARGFKAPVESKAGTNVEAKDDTNIDTKLVGPLKSESESESSHTPAAVVFEILSKEDAVNQVNMRTGVPADFAGYVYDDWESRGGKDGSGVFVQWAGYCYKRWNREGNEWKAGTHKGKQNPRNTNGTHRSSTQQGTQDRNAGTYNAGRGKEYAEHVRRKNAQARLQNVPGQAVGEHAGEGGIIPHIDAGKP